MKNKIYLLLLITSLFQTQLNSQTTIQDTFVFDGIERNYILYVPAIYNASQEVPLLLNLHGYTSGAAEQNYYADFKPIADTANFIMVLPNGSLSQTNNQPFWNFGIWGETVDDFAFLNALIDTVIQQFSIDETRIYSTGMSNGGFMSYALACNNPRITAIGSVTGAMTLSMYTNCNVNDPVPIIEIHGTADSTVPYNGSALVQATEDVVDLWVTKNGCNPAPTITPVPNINVGDLCTAERYLYSGGINGHTIELFKVTDGGHTWPGAPIPLPASGNTCMDFSASIEIWRFLSQYQKTDELGISKINPQEVTLYPNPSNGKIQLISSKAIKKIIATNTMGKIVKTIDGLDNRAIDLSELNQGTYFLQLIGSDGSYIRKVILTE